MLCELSSSRGSCKISRTGVDNSGLRGILLEIKDVDANGRQSERESQDCSLKRTSHDISYHFMNSCKWERCSVQKEIL